MMPLTPGMAKTCLRDMGADPAAFCSSTEVFLPFHRGRLSSSVTEISTCIIPT